MNQTYLDFLNFDAVASVPTQDEFDKLVKLCKTRGLEGVTTIKRIGYGDLHRSGGIQVIPYGELCVEFRMSDGTFTIGARKSYEDYGCRVVTVSELA